MFNKFRINVVESSSDFPFSHVIQFNSSSYPNLVGDQVQEQEASFNISRIFCGLNLLIFRLYINSIWLLLLRSGDIETNPGQIKLMKDMLLECETYSDNLESLHLNIRSITRKQHNE